MKSFKDSINEMTHVSQQLKDDILEAESNDDNKWKNKSNLISKLVITFLNTHGTLIKSDTTFYYFNKIDKKLYSITDINFSYLLSKYSWINKQEHVFKFILSAIEVEIFDHWKEVKIKSKILNCQSIYYHFYVNTVLIVQIQSQEVPRILIMM